jgi:hypothetical protein
VGVHPLDQHERGAYEELDTLHDQLEQLEATLDHIDDVDFDDQLNFIREQLEANERNSIQRKLYYKPEWKGIPS